MYTQCPECATAFRVTADILRQAAGKVRCGGCGNAFNALMYLSETRPEAPARQSDDESALPELRPEEEGRDAADDEPPPRAISPEQSAALLETLDELSGENIRLEDTGIEWRVLPEDDDDDSGSASGIRARQGEPVDADISGDAGASRVDELLEDSPTPVDEFLTATPHDLDAPEVFADGGDTPAGGLEASEVFEDAAGEMRFDDNTGLPEDFDFDSDEPPQPAARQREAAADPAPPATPEPDPLQVDIAFGDPAEWGALLDEVDHGGASDEPTADDKAAPRAAETAAEADSEDEAVIDDDELLDLDTQFGLQAEALGIRERVDESIGEAPDEDDDEQVATDGTDGIVLEDDEDDRDDGTSAAGNEDDEDEAATSIDEDLYRAAFEAEAREDEIPIPESTGELESELARARAAYEDALEDDDEESLDESLEVLLEPDFDDVAEADEDMPSAIHDLELELDGDAAAPASDDDDDFDLVAERSDGEQQPTILPMSDEEQTINQMIDEDMLRMAVEEDDGLSSSMVLKALDIEAAAAAEKAGDDAPESDDDAPAGVGVETIIMEGEFVRTALEEQALAEQRDEPQDETGHEAEEPAGNRVISALKSTIQGRAKEEAPVDDSRRRYGLVAGIGVLTLLLVGQLVHQSRAELATIPALNGIIAPIYRTLGAPITPQWDVTGWRFEVTRGSTNAAALADELAEDGRGVDFGGAASGDPEVLTIYSRIGNQAEQPLPYPLVSVSLTDRFEEIIGSKVLSPNEYLTGDFDPRRLVPPGETFNAVITIESPAAEATGFKLNVCYREAGGQLRCAIEDFL